jgi:hypothetical protein
MLEETGVKWLVVGIFVICIILILFLKNHFVRKRRRRDYCHIQSNRTPLSDEDFCHREGLDPAIADLVHTIRHRLAKDSGCDPLRIYPDDSFFDDFGWSYGDLEMLEDDMDLNFEIECSYVGTFILEIARLRKEREQREQDNETPPVNHTIASSKQ